MKRLGLLLLLVCANVLATTTVTGKIQSLGTGAFPSGTFARFWLRGCGGNLPRINGTSVIGPSKGGVFFFDFPADSSGNVSGALYSTRHNEGTGNGDLECGGSKTAAWYAMQVFYAGRGGPEVQVHAKSSSTLDITNVTPITTNPVTTAPKGDTTYARLDSGNQPFTGKIQEMGSTLGTENGVYNVAMCGRSPTPSWCSGSDMGAWINAAVVTAPSGSRIYIPASTSCTSYTTPIVFGLGRFDTLQGEPGNSSCIKYTPSTGAAITFDPGTNDHPDYGIRDLQIIGPGNATSTVGIQLGVANGAQGIVLRGIRTGTNCCSSDGFGKGIQQSRASFGASIENSYIAANGIGLNQAVAQENTRIMDSSFSHNSTNAVVMATSSSNDLYISGTSFDDNGAPAISMPDNTGGLGNHLVLSEDHFENSTVGTAAAPYISVGNGDSVVLLGGMLMDDRLSGTNSTGFITCSGFSYVTILSTVRYNGGINVTPSLNPSGNCRGFLQWNQKVGAGSFTEVPTNYTGGPIYQTSTDALGTQGQFQLINGASSSNVTIPFGANLTTGLTGNLSSTQLGRSTTYSGLYEVCIALWPTATGSATSIQATVTSNNGAVFTANVGSVLSLSARSNTGGGCFPFHANASVTISVATTGYSGTGTYSVECSVWQRK